MLLQRLATGATGVKQARYRRRPTRGSEALVRACAVYTQHYHMGISCCLNSAEFVNPRRACAARVTVVVPCVCVSVCPGLASATHATTRPSRHTYGLSIVLAPELIWRFSYNGLVSKIAIALPRGGWTRPRDVRNNSIPEHGALENVWGKRFFLVLSFTRAPRT